MKRALLLALLVFPAAAQPPIPSGPTGAVFSAWLEAVNSGDEARVRAFAQTYAPDRPELPDRQLSLYRQSGGFDLLSVEASEPGRLTGQLHERTGGRTAAFTFNASGDPPRFQGMRLAPVGATATPLPAVPNALDPIAALDEAARRSDFSGAVLVARNGDVLFEKAYGLADRGQGTANTVDARLRIGSMNKMFTAVAILQLVNEGKLQLDAPLRTYLPDYPNAELAAKVTIRHLLTHTGGTGDIFTPEYERARATLREPKDYVKLLGTRGLEFQPGTRWAYSNYGYVLLGVVIEAVAGVSYYDYVRDRVFEPAGMTDTDSLPTSADVPRLAIGYTRQSGSPHPNTDQLPPRPTPAGGGYSTVGDLLKFATALTSGKLLPQRWLAEATQPQASQGPGYGYGFGTQGTGPRAHFGHNGGAPGQNGELRIYPATGYVVAALANADPPAASQLVELFEERNAR